MWRLWSSDHTMERLTRMDNIGIFRPNALFQNWSKSFELYEMQAESEGVSSGWLKGQLISSLLNSTYFGKWEGLLPSLMFVCDSSDISGWHSTLLNLLTWYDPRVVHNVLSAPSVSRLQSSTKRLISRNLNMMGKRVTVTYRVRVRIFLTPTMSPSFYIL